MSVSSRVGFGFGFVGAAVSVSSRVGFGFVGAAVSVSSRVKGGGRKSRGTFEGGAAPSGMFASARTSARRSRLKPPMLRGEGKPPMRRDEGGGEGKQAVSALATPPALGTLLGTSTKTTGVFGRKLSSAAPSRAPRPL